MLSAQNIIGTISYMAPEQLQGRPSPASDQYALGIVVYEWLCGSCPFQGPVVHNLQLYEPPPSLRTRIPALSPAIELVVMKALAKQSEQRFVTVQAFAEALKQQTYHVQASTPPLFLSGNGGVQGHTTLKATETVLAPSPVPPTMAAPPAAPPFPVTIIANASRPVQPRHSRRMFLSSLIGLAAIGGASALGLWMVQQRGQAKPPTPTGPQHAPTPKATSIPSKGNALFTYTGHQDQVFTAAWSPDDRYIASAGGDTITRQGDTRVHVWEALTGQYVYMYPGHSRLVRMVAWSPDGQRIASASEDRSVQIWDATNGGNSLIYRGHTNEVWAVTWSPDGTLIASAGKDQTVQVWYASTGQSRFTYTGHVKNVTSVAWSPDGKLIASASSDGKVYIWDAAMGMTQQFFPHKSVVGSLAWSPDSMSIATGDYNDDDSVRIWDISTGGNTQVFPGVPDTPGNPVNTVA